jgi:ectoine hydroxylase-related dioxygenase (phytanoyl-CoA dioxygenase family)
MPRNGETRDASWVENLGRDGYAILEGVATPDRVAALIEATREYASGTHDGRLDRRGEVYGARDLLWRVPEAARLARSPELSAIAEAVVGPGAFSVRGLFFDKTPTVNWNLPWHQDLSIAVRGRRDVPGFGPWTRKGGIPHAHAPAALLSRMVTIRLHLDDCGPASGPMRVLPGSHAAGKLDPGAIAAWTARAGTLAVDCLVPAGGVVVMRPLLLHASALSTGAGRRRVIHLEYAAGPLPGGLEWYQPEDVAVAVGSGWSAHS